MSQTEPEWGPHEWAVPPNGEAERLVRAPLLVELFARLEREALERAVSAAPGDDEGRRLALFEVRALRSLRARLEALAKGRLRHVQPKTLP